MKKEGIFQLQYLVLMMANYERVTQLLQKMQRSEFVKYVQSELQILSQDPLFINLLAVAIRDKNINHNTKLAAAITLNRIISQNYHEFQQRMLIDLLIGITLDLSVEFKYKTAYQNSLISLFQLADQELIEEMIQQYDVDVSRQACIEQEYHFASENSNQGIIKNTNLLNVQVMFFIYKCILDSNNHLTTLGSHIYNNISKIVRKVQIVNNPENIKLLKQMDCFFAPFLQQLNQSDQCGCDQYADQLCSNEYFLGWVYDQLNLQATAGQCWISCNVSDDHNLLNDLKTKVAEVHQNVLAHYGRNLIQGIFISQKHYQCCGLLMNTLTTFAAFNAQLSSYQTFATVLIRNLLLLYRINSNHFINIYGTILHSIVFPILKIKQQEMILFQQEPEQFNRLAEDCCDHQKFGILKSQISMLLQIICDQNDQAAEYVIQHSILSLKVQLSLDQNLKMQAPNFLPIQTAFLILCIQSYKLSKYNAELEQLKNILKFQNIKGRLSNLQLNRLFTFLAYNFSEIYKNPYEGQIWINLALASDGHKSVQISALDFISNVVQDYFSVEFLLNFGNKSLVKSPLYLKNFIKIISVHMNKIEQKQMILVIDILFKQITRQLDLYNKRQRSHTMEIVSCLHLLKKIIDKPDYCNDKPAVSRAIWNVLNFMPRLQHYSLDEEVIRIVVSFIVNKVQFITEQILLTLNPFIKIYQHDRQQSSTYLIYFNSILMKASCQVALLIGQVLLQTFVKKYQQVKFNPKLINCKIALGSILVLLQNIIALHGNDLGDSFLDKISNLCLMVIPEDDNPQDKIQYILVARALNLLFLCHMHRKHEQALRKMLAFQDSPIFQGYDLQVLCLCFAKQIFREDDIIAVTEMINLMVKAIAASKQQSITIKSKKNPHSIKPSSTKIRIKRIEDYEKILKFIKTPFPQTSLAQLQLKNIIQTMKKNNPFLYQSIIKSLNQTVVTKLKELMTEVVVQGKKRKVVHVGTLKQNAKNMNTQTIIRGIKKRHLQQSENQQKQDEIQSKKHNLHKKKLKNEATKQSQVQQQVQ